VTAVLLSPLMAYAAAALVVFGGWRAFQIVSAGWTAKQTERALHRHSTALKGITRGGAR
jgi:hypothetical protein